MSATHYLLDSDVAKALCQYCLVEDLAIALGVTVSDFAVLSQLRFQLHHGNRSRSLKKLGSERAVQQLDVLISQCSEVVALVESANFLLLSGTPDIDGGELALFAALCEDPTAELVTGDKRALIALCKVGEPVSSAFRWAQIMCLEEAFAHLVRHFGCSYVSERVRARLDVNHAVSNIFGRSAPASEVSILEGIDSYLGELQQLTQGKYSPSLGA